jgi:predicted PurR-regulated permease PerM
MIVANTVKQLAHDRRSARLIELAIRLSVFALLIYLSFVLIAPFLTIAIWSTVITVALYPLYCRIVHLFRGRRQIAAIVLTLLSFLVVIGPATWLILGLLDGIQTLYSQLALSGSLVPQPRESVRNWPLVGDRIFQIWSLAADNLRAAMEAVGPQLKQMASSLLQIAAGAGVGALKFFVALAVAGFLYAPAPTIVDFHQFGC